MGEGLILSRYQGTLRPLQGIQTPSSTSEPPPPPTPSQHRHKHTHHTSFPGLLTITDRSTRVPLNSVPKTSVSLSGKPFPHTALPRASDVPCWERERKTSHVPYLSSLGPELLQVRAVAIHHRKGSGQEEPRRVSQWRESSGPGRKRGKYE